MDNVTFLLGAGASANAVPLTYQIPLHLRFMADYIEKNLPVNKASKYVSDIKELQLHLNEFNTIDNYARVLSQNRVSSSNNQLKKLKSILCGLFMFEQLKKKNDIINQFDNVPDEEVDKVRKTIDLRYKSFFAKVLNGEKLDDRINIVSWNYDMQLEIGLESNLGYNYDELQNSCQIYPHPSCEVAKKENHFFSHDWMSSPRIVKLNGTAGVFLKDSSFHNIYINQQEYFDDRLDVLLDIHKEILRYQHYNPFLKFAWERDDQGNKALDYASAILSKTNILVVIGYSFPDFNRPIDQQIFSQKRIDEIFVQMPSEDFDTVKYSMQASLGRLADKAVLIKSLKEFFIPKQFIPVY